MLASIFGTETKCPDTQSDVPVTPPLSPVRPDTNAATQELPYLVGAIHDLLDLGSKLEALFDAMPQDQLGPSLRVVMQELFDAYTEVYGDPDEQPTDDEPQDDEQPVDAPALVRQHATARPEPSSIPLPSTQQVPVNRQLPFVPECKSPTRRPNTTRARPVMLP